MRRFLPIAALMAACAQTTPVPPGPAPAPRPEQAVEFFRQAELAMQAEPPQVSAAIQYFTLAIQQDPAYPQAYLGRGRAHAMLGERDAAEQDMSKAIEVAGEDKRALYFLLRARYYHAEARELGKAEADYETAMQWEEKRPDPYLVDVLLHRALMYLDTGRADRAIADYERILQLNPDPETREQVKNMIAAARRPSR